MARRGVMLVVSSPSGGGKSSLARALVARDPMVRQSVSATTRPPRGAEVEGGHYRFMDRAAFLRQRDAGAFLEWAEVHGNLYGTPRDAAEAELAAGRDLVLAIDWQGARSLSLSMPRDVVGVFLLPPSAAELRARLTSRGEDAEETVALRLANARDEIAQWKAYDHVVVNDAFEGAFAQIRAILDEARAGARPSRRVPHDVERRVRLLDEELSMEASEPPPYSMGA
jgi:guanylate kinase